MDCFNFENGKKCFNIKKYLLMFLGITILSILKEIYMWVFFIYLLIIVK